VFDAALLAAANETIRTLDAENAELHAANRDLNGEVTALRAALVDMERQRDSARSIAVRCGAFDSSAGTDYEAHLGPAAGIGLVDPEGRLFK